MQIKTRLTESDFIKVNFVLLLERPTTKLAIGIFIVVIAYSAIFPITRGGHFSVGAVIPILFPVIILSLFTYITAKMNYKSNSRINETIEYIFESDHLEVKGESFTSRLTWAKIYKVTKTNQWLLIWQNRQIANVIPLRDVWAGDITTLKEILVAHNVKNNL